MKLIHICPLNLHLYKIIQVFIIKNYSIYANASIIQYIYRLICQSCRVLAMLAHGLHDLSMRKVVRLLQLEM